MSSSASSGSTSEKQGPPPQPLPTDTQAGIWSIFLIISPFLILWSSATLYDIYKVYQNYKKNGADALRLNDARKNYINSAFALGCVNAYAVSLFLASVFYEACAGQQISVWQTNLGRTHFAFEFSEMFFILLSSFFLFMKWFELWAGYDRFKSNEKVYWTARIAFWTARLVLGFGTLFSCASIIPAFVWVTIMGNGGPASPPHQLTLDFLFIPSSVQMLIGGVGMMIAGLALNFIFVRMSAKSSLSQNEQKFGLVSASLFTRTSLLSAIAVACAVVRSIVVFGFDSRLDWVRYTRLMMELVFGFLNVAVHGGERCIVSLIKWCLKPCSKNKEYEENTTEKEMNTDKPQDRETREPKETENIEHNNENQEEKEVV